MVEFHVNRTLKAALRQNGKLKRRKRQVLQASAEYITRVLDPELEYETARALIKKHKVTYPPMNLVYQLMLEALDIDYDRFVELRHLKQRRQGIAQH